MPESRCDRIISEFGATVSERFATGGGEPEDLIRGPFEHLFTETAGLSGVTKVVLNGEHHLADERVRPDYAVYVAGALVGFVELKAPGRGVDPSRFKGHDKQQWERLACLPNVLYSDGHSFALFRDGELAGEPVAFDGDLRSAGAGLTVDSDALVGIIDAFVRWHPVPPSRPRELARTAARLCRLLRAEVAEALGTDSGLRQLADDWRWLLFPEATDAEFADRYAQTVTFALLLARVEGIGLTDRPLDDIASELGRSHTLMGRALDVLTDGGVVRRLAVSVSTLQRVLGVVDWTRLTRRNPSAAWLYFYEEFLDVYDPALRRATGSYYTPVEVVDPMVRLVEELLIDRLSQADGFASPSVTTVDPGVGTGTFLFRIMERIAGHVEHDEGQGAVGPRLRQAASRLIGFELQAGPYSVAELRLSAEFATRGAHLRAGELRLYLADTLANPFEAEEHIPAILAPIAASRVTANKVKATEPVMVVIGNPPYRERSHGEGGWVEQGGTGFSSPLANFKPPPELRVGAHVKHLYNPYVYFWRWATWKVFESHPTDKGVVAFITAAGFVGGPGFAGMRTYLRRTCDALWVIDCSPEGHQPEVPTRIFQGVQQPVCIMIALRDGSSSQDEPATVLYTSVSGRREDKFSQLAGLHLSGEEWSRCPTEWHAPFLPTGRAAWTTMPAVDDLLAWSGSGTMPGRTWVVGPSPSTLTLRWARLISAHQADKPALLAEHVQDRRVDTHLSDNLPGYVTPNSTIGDETEPCPPPERYGYRSFDRAWVIPDKRVINRPNPALWQIRHAPDQTFLTMFTRTSPSAGPALTATALIPDLDHYHGSFGGRAWPLWLDSAGTVSNLSPGLLSFLADRYDVAIRGADVFAYIAGLLAHPDYTETFAADLLTPGLRVPLTAKAEVFTEAVTLGRRVLWLHTFGERFVDKNDGRPAGPPRLPLNRRPAVLTAIPDSTAGMPRDISYSAASRSLLVGDGRIAPVAQEVWDYGVSGRKVVKRWFDSRKQTPDGRRSSPLDDIVADRWAPEWTTELLQVINVLTLLVDVESEQAKLLARVTASDLLSVDDLVSAGVLPVKTRLQAEKPPRGDRIF